MKFQTLCAMSALVLLSACGGESGAPPAGSVTPTPTPSPTPTPTPPPSYSTFAEIEQGQFASACATKQTSAYPAEVLDVSAFGQGPTFDFTRATSTWKATGAGVDFELDESDRRSTTSSSIEIFLRNHGVSTSEALAIFNPSVTAGFGQYTRLLNINYMRPSENIRTIDCVIGAPTDPADTLQTSRSRFATITFFNNIRINHSGGSIENRDVVTRDLDVTYTPSDRSVGFTSALDVQTYNSAGEPIMTSPIGTFTATASLAAGQTHFRGEIKNAAGSTVGAISGSFFGPQGSEVAFVYGLNVTLANGQSGAVTGQIVGGDPTAF